MARGIAYWQTVIDDATASKPSIASLLSNPSSVAVYKLFRDIFAFVADIIDQFFDQFKADVAVIESTRSYGHPLWWQDKMKEFQYGDTIQALEVDTPFGKQTIPQYATIDESKQIIKFVAVVPISSGTSLIKVAKDDGSGNPIPLNNSELDAVKIYINSLQVMGAFITATSKPSDKVKYAFDIYYNPQVIASDGSLITDAGVFPFEYAINIHHTKLRFDGTIVIEDLEAELRKVNGYVDHLRTAFDARPDAGSFLPFDRFYTSNSGYVEIDVAFPLSNTLNYIPDPNVL